jgi:hypothetical protein
MGVLVLGMHRSGTSALTRVLNLLGLDAGREVLIGASESNPTGHWEVEQLTSFNDRLLDEVGGRWSAPPLLEPDALEALAGGAWGAEAGELHAEAFGGTASWVWKDPRLCLLLPFWRTVLRHGDGPPAHEVVALRDPHEIARSLAARDGMAVGFGLALWERYSRSLLAALDGHDACFVHYERLLAEPEVVARELVAALLGLSGPVHRFTAPDLPPETTNLQLAFAEAKRLSWHLEENERLRDGIDHLIATHREQVDHLVADAEARSAEASDLAQQVVAIRAEADDYLRQLTELRDRLPIRAYTKAKGLLGR